MFRDITAIILGGGEGRRMGGSKSWALLNGRPLVEYVTNTVREITGIIIFSHGSSGPEWGCKTGSGGGNEWGGDAESGSVAESGRSTESGSVAENGKGSDTERENDSDWGRNFDWGRDTERGIESEKWRDTEWGGEKWWSGTIPVADIFPGCGPAGGIYSALLHSESEFNLVLSCDIPFVGVDLLRFLIVESQRCGAPVTLPVDEGGCRQPLCAVYRKSILPFLEAALSGNKLKLIKIIEEAGFCEVEITTDHPCYSPVAFLNLNTPGDLREAEEYLRGRQP